MPLTIRHGTASSSLFSEFADRSGFLWFTHRLHRDLLLEHAAETGKAGWLNPPFAFFSELPARFGLKAKAISLLDRHSLVNRLAVEHAQKHGIRLPDAGASITRSSMLDSFFSELLPEGITANDLAGRLGAVAEDDFARRRNAWITAVYAAYLNELQVRGQYDPRQVHSLIAERIENGELPRAINDAKELHIYGLYSTRSRRRLLKALAAQQDVDVVVYTNTAAVDDFKPFGTRIEEITTGTAKPLVQPAPDAWREAEWIAGEVKRLIVNEQVEPHDIAIVARTGLEDTRRTLQVLRSAGIPCTARVRSPLTEIGAIKAMLVLFRAAAEEWSYPNLRNVLTSPYFKTRVDVRTIDRIAQEARPHSLARWSEELGKVIARDTAEAAKQTDPERAAAIMRRVQRYRDTVEPFADLTQTLTQLDDARTLTEWIELTRELLGDGWLDYRRRICRPPMERNDVVRFDQRAVRQLEKLLQQWGSVAQADAAMPPAEWYALLRALLAGQELALTTPGQKGVQILEAHDAALVPFRATFLLHANDGVFPRLPSPGGLFAEEERAALHAAGLPIETFETSWQREAALWQAVTSGERVTITYRTTDPKGTPLLPSLLVPAHDESAELARSTDLASEPLNAQQESYDAACELGDAVRKGKRPSRILTSDPAAMRHTILQAHAEQQRGAPSRTSLAQPLNPWNGVIRDPLVLARIGEKFGAAHKWSASQLEQYGKNPFFYLIDRVLRLEEAEEADEETNALTTGGVAHDILELFYGELKDRFGAINIAEATILFGNAARTIFEEREASGEWLGMPVLWQQRKHWICETLVKFIEWDVPNLLKKGERPWAFEHEIDRELTRNGSSMLLRGFIDRVDELKHGRFRVLDYKTNTVPSGKSGFEDGAVLQGVIYIEALIQEGINADCSQYRSLKGCKNGAAITTGDSEYDVALDIAFSIPDRVRRGLFEANLAESVDSWAPWFPDMSIVRNRAQLEKGTVRFT